MELKVSKEALEYIRQNGKNLTIDIKVAGG